MIDLIQSYWFDTATKQYLGELLGKQIGIGQKLSDTSVYDGVRVGVNFLYFG